jgi:hypothetical protein
MAGFCVLLFVRQVTTTQPHYPVIYALIMGVIGLIVTFQVHRVRSLNRYFEQSRAVPRTVEGLAQRQRTPGRIESREAANVP